MTLDRGAGVALVMLSGVAAGCDNTPLAAPPPVTSGGAGTTGAAGAMAVVPQALVIPDDVVAPVMGCSNGFTYALNLPCQLGESPVFETDCSFDKGANNYMRFGLPQSLPDAGGSFSGPPLGTQQRFRAHLVAPNAVISSGALDYYLTSMDGTVTFTKGVLTDRTLDGWFTHLDFVFTSGEHTISCSLDRGRFTTVPGAYE